MTQSVYPSILILPNVTFGKYHEEDHPLPYEATPAKVREELARRLPDVEIQLPADDLAARTHLPQAHIVLAERFTRDMLAAASRYAGWGYFDFRMKGEGFDEGFQSVPVNWGISSPRKKAFFDKLKEVTGEP